MIRGSIFGYWRHFELGVQRCNFVNNLLTSIQHLIDNKLTLFQQFIDKLSTKQEKRVRAGFLRKTPSQNNFKNTKVNS